MTMGTIDAIRLSRNRRIGVSHANFASHGELGAGMMLVRFWHYFRALAAKRRSRIALGELTAEQLVDIGLNEAEARQESVVPFWR